MRTHSTWIIGSALLAFAVEGWQGSIGESLAHAGMSKSILGVIGATLFGWLYSWLIEPEHKPKRPPKKRRPKSH